MTIAMKQDGRAVPTRRASKRADRSSSLGATLVGGGAYFSLVSRTATGVEPLLLDSEDDAAPSRTICIDPASQRTYDYLHAIVPAVETWRIYGYRVEGPSEPARGLRFDPSRLLIEWARASMRRPDGPLASTEEFSIPICCESGGEVLAILRDHHSRWQAIREVQS